MAHTLGGAIVQNVRLTGLDLIVAARQTLRRTDVRPTLTESIIIFPGKPSQGNICSRMGRNPVNLIQVAPRDSEYRRDPGRTFFSQEWKDDLPRWIVGVTVI